MNRVLQVLVGIAAIVGGISLLAMHSGAFRNHLRMQSDAVGRTGFVTEVKVVGGKSEVHFEFTEPMKTKVYTGMSVLVGTSFRALAVGAATPIQYLEGNPEVNRHQFARDEIFTSGRNVAIGVFLVIIGLALMARVLQESSIVTAWKSVEAKPDSPAD